MSMAEAKRGRLFGYHYFRITTRLMKQGVSLYCPLKILIKEVFSS
jgi:hypothetical protein